VSLQNTEQAGRVQEHLRDRELQLKQVLFGGGKDVEAKRKSRACTVCRTMGQWYLVSSKCKVDANKLETRILQIRKQIKQLVFCKECGHHGEIGFLCTKCENRLTTYMIDRTGGWRPTAKINVRLTNTMS